MTYLPQGVSTDPEVNAALAMIGQDLVEPLTVAVGRVSALIESPATDLKATYDLMQRLSSMLLFLRNSQENRNHYAERH